MRHSTKTLSVGFAVLALLVALCAPPDETATIATTTPCAIMQARVKKGGKKRRTTAGNGDCTRTPTVKQTARADTKSECRFASLVRRLFRRRASPACWQ
jgi:hypothetical protein